MSVFSSCFETIIQFIYFFLSTNWFFIVLDHDDRWQIWQLSVSHSVSGCHIFLMLPSHHHTRSSYLNVVYQFFLGGYFKAIFYGNFWLRQFFLLLIASGYTWFQSTIHGTVADAWFFDLSLFLVCFLKMFFVGQYFSCRQLTHSLTKQNSCFNFLAILLFHFFINSVTSFFKQSSCYIEIVLVVLVLSFKIDVITVPVVAFYRMNANQQMMLKTKKRMGKETRKNLSIRQYSSASCCTDMVFVTGLS